MQPKTDRFIRSVFVLMNTRGALVVVGMELWDLKKPVISIVHGHQEETFIQHYFKANHVFYFSS